MRLVQINTTCGIGSTGKICIGISEALNVQAIENYILYSCYTNGYVQGIGCSNKHYVKLQILRSRLLGNYGFTSRKATQRMISELERIQPDVVHLHNIHGHDCNISILFRYFKKKKIKLLWTFHDCWAFTGYCPYYDMARCDRWKAECKNCPQYRRFSWFKDRSGYLYREKKKLFTGLDLTIITPSQWLADQVKESFLKEVPTKVIHNGIDLSVFQPVVSNFRRQHNLPEEKFILLGVAFDWGLRKGLDVFCRLAERLDADKFQIVLVGTNDKIDKQLPQNIISIHRTNNQQELAEIYSAAGLFVNPTREEVFGLVNIEANACGTPVLTFRTGGSPECIDETSGMVVDCDDEEALYNAILYIEKERPFSAENCRNRALKFSEEAKYGEYVELVMKSME